MDEETRLGLVYTVDVWTSASIDITTAATQRVTEQRDEINVLLDRAFPDFALGGSYRYSIENDYESHGGTLGGSFDFADKAANLALLGRISLDEVWAAGDASYKRPARTLSGRVTFTQVIDPSSLAQLVYELGHNEGFLSSPYRYVRVADSLGNGRCTGNEVPIATCLIEQNPDSRVRHAVAVRGRRAFTDALSAGLGYRYYFDDWGLDSHTIEGDVAILPGDAWMLAFGYRFYVQSGADHYAPFYLPMPLPAHYTSDKELSALSSHRISAEISRVFDLDDSGTRLRAVLLAAPSFFSYPDFPLLDRVTAFETTFSVGVER